MPTNWAATMSALAAPFAPLGRLCLVRCELLPMTVGGGVSSAADCGVRG
eukprot:CAMPEP_0180652734 /NCGR_PEP_ID=MMETSP1037_2-20121125/53662_1 /TAXON_ID=632150 /ORGANISM="Azadinium spinosum, Strain 3D9" /LENGTH=48 /DNA_ID= /DNA_START= /DNA_END= /DNA_ORIENTATION=